MAHKFSVLSAVLAFALLSATACSGWGVTIDDVTSEDIILRIQHTKLRFEDKDWGWDPMFYGSYDIALDPWVFGGMLGAGSGWDVHATRWEGKLTAGYRLGPMFLSCGYYLIDMNSSAYMKPRWSYHGPDLSASGGYTFGDTDISIYGSASLLPYLFTGYKRDVMPKQTGNTWGYAFDAGLSYSFLELWKVSAGYRFTQIEGADVGDYQMGDERLHGPYIEGCFIW